MSKSSKWPKEVVAAETEEKPNVPSNKMALEDIRLLRLALADTENARLKLHIATINENSVKSQLQAKYSLTDKDGIDNDSGEITRAKKGESNG